MLKEVVVTTAFSKSIASWELANLQPIIDQLCRGSDEHGITWDTMDNGFTPLKQHRSLIYFIIISCLEWMTVKCNLWQLHFINKVGSVGNKI